MQERNLNFSRLLCSATRNRNYFFACVIILEQRQYTYMYIAVIVYLRNFSMGYEMWWIPIVIVNSHSWGGSLQGTISFYFSPLSFSLVNGLYQEYENIFTDVGKDTTLVSRETLLNLEHCFWYGEYPSWI